MKLHIKFAAILLSVASAQAVQAGQIITALNTDDNGADVHVDLSSSTAGALVSYDYKDTNVRAQTQLGINKVSGGFYGSQYSGQTDTGIELSGTSAWLDTFTAVGCTGCKVHYEFTFTVDGTASFIQDDWATTHFNFQVVALRGDGWSINGSGDQTYGASGNGTFAYWKRTGGTDFDELYFEQKAPGRVTQMALREENEVFYNFTPDGTGAAGAFTGAAQRVTDASGSYFLRAVLVGSGPTQTVQYMRLYDNGWELRTGSNTGPAARNAYVPGSGPKLILDSLQANFSLLGTSSLCGYDALAGEKQCAPGNWGPTPVTVAFDVLAGSRFSIAGVMTMDELDDGSVNFFNTAKLTGIGAKDQYGNQAGLTSDALGTVVDIRTGKVTYPSTAPGAVPEPASWAMMIGGLGLAGGLLRRKKLLATA